MGVSKLTASGLLLACLLLAPGAARADGPSKAEELFREARRLMDAKEYGAACEKFVESQKLEPASGTLLNLGDCYEKNGQTASAYRTFKEAAKAALSRNKQDWANIASQRVALLEPRLATITIAVTPGAAEVRGLHVERDGVGVEREAWGKPVPVDPGPHVLAASAPGHKPWTTRVQVVAAKRTVVDVPLLVEEAPGTPPVVVTPPVKEEPPKDEQTPPKGGGATKVVGYALAGVGLVALGAGTFTGIRALGARSDAAGRCDSYPTRCGPEASGPNDDAKTFATISTISLVAGAALVAGGVALVILSGRKPAEKREVRLVPRPLGAGLDVTF